MNWKDLAYWKSGEYQVVEERLADLTKAGIPWCPGKKNLFKALDVVPFDKVRVAIVGQDPYPSLKHATGVAFDVPEGTKTLPPTLVNLLTEYANDLNVEFPTNPSLKKWTEQGVLLWNALPSCTEGRIKSHDWPEWWALTEEIIKKLSNNDTYIPFVFLGSFAKLFAQFVNQDECDVIETSHPSPRGSLNARAPFKGSRIFSRINDLLCSHGEASINWKL